MAHKTKSHIPWWIVRSGGMWVLADLPRAAVLGYAIRYAPVPTAKIVWATGARMGPATAGLASDIAGIVYAHSRTVRAGVKGGKVVARFAAAAVAGYAIGATVGTGIAYAGWGGAGARDAVSLYTGGVSSHQYFSTVGGAIAQILEPPGY